jgi:protein-tyrosine phosphatase
LRYGPDDVTVTSAGVYGAPAEPPDVLVKEGLAFGLDLSRHTPRRIDAASIARADLIVGMEREHVREVVLADTSSFSKVYTLREIVRRGEQKGHRDGGESLADWLERVSMGRRHLDLVGDSPIDDISDPMGGTPQQFRQMLTDVQALTRRLYLLIWP